MLRRKNKLKSRNLVMAAETLREIATEHNTNQVNPGRKALRNTLLFQGQLPILPPGNDQQKEAEKKLTWRDEKGEDLAKVCVKPMIRRNSR